MDEYDKIPDSVDPGEPVVPVASETVPENEANEEGPEPQLMVDEDGKYYLAFEVEPPEGVEEETTDEEGGEEK